MPLEDELSRILGTEPEDVMNQPTVEPPVVVDESKAQQQNMEQRISAVSEQAAEARVLARMAADPDFQRVLKLKQEGKTLRIEDGSVQPANASSQVTPSVELKEDMSPQELVKYMTQEMSKNMTTLLDQRLAPVNKQLEQFGGYVSDVQRNSAAEQIKAAQQKYSDFNEFSPQMANLSTQNPSLSAEELYIVAKTRAGKPLVTDRAVETERPSSTAARPGRPATPLTGRGGFKTALAGALSRVKLESID